MLRGLTPQVVPSRTGQVLDRRAATATIVRALASLNREPVGLPVRVDRPKVNAGDLTVAAAQVRTALSAPVHLTLGETRWNLRPGRASRGCSNCPLTDGAVSTSPGTARARGSPRWASASTHRPEDATWAISSNGRVRVVPDHPGYLLDVPHSAKAVLRAALVTDPSLRFGEARRREVRSRPIY